ncbi:MAG: O-antigen ligase family protein, partial [Elusimicrobia bacterium]|nr:O-antigen ligase family protein [Elusimicrobiota bacterium]
CAWLAKWAVSSHKSGRWVFTQSAPDKPFLLWVLVCMASLAWAFFGADEFFRPAILSRGGEKIIFLFVNCLLVYWISKSVSCSEKPLSKPLFYTCMLIVWGMFWALFGDLRIASKTQDFFWRIFDVYGALMWLAGIALARKVLGGAKQEDFLHIAFAVGAIAGGYSIMQFFGIDWIWPRGVNAFGSRAVSTFGNPNLISSYLAMILPSAGVYFLHRRDLPGRFFYGFLFAVYISSIAISSTRSSWLGILAAFAVLLIVPASRRLILSSKKPALALAVVCAAVLFWPLAKGAILQRAAELPKPVVLFSMPSSESMVYSPMHQRFLMWSCALKMGAENPLLGKGWGLLELYYPLYQGPMIIANPALKNLRTRANFAHNEIIEVFSQTGVLGLGLYVLMILVFLKSFASRLKSLPHEKQLFCAAMFAGITAMFADNMLNISLHFAVPAFLFWWMFGALSGETSGRESFAPCKLPSAGLALFFSAAVIFMSVCQWAGEIYSFRGGKFFYGKNLIAAKADLKKSLWWNFSDIRANYMLGGAYSLSGESAPAYKTYLNAISADFSYDEIYYNLGVISGNKLGAKDEGIKFLETAILINPTSATAYSALISLMYDEPKKYYAKAVEILDRAVKLIPDKADFYNALGYFHARAGNREKALPAFKRALELAPGNKAFTANVTNLESSLKLGK